MEAGLVENSKPTQAARVLGYLLSGARLTQLEAWEHLGVMCLASRVDELRNAGHNIESERVDVFNKYGEKCSVVAYSLTQKGRAQ